MCMVVDANAASHLCNTTVDGKPVLAWLLKHGRLAIGGTVTDELIRAGLRETLVALDRAGRIRRFEGPALVDAERGFRGHRHVRSNDQHVLALVSVSRCSVVFSGDQRLHSDLKNKLVLDARPSIYQNESHKHLLTPDACK
jgi:hypothetical protein